MRKLTTKLTGDTNSHQKCRNFVADIFPKVEADVRELPNAVDAVAAFWLSEDIFKLTLERRMNKDVTTSVSWFVVSFKITGFLNSYLNEIEAYRKSIQN